MYSLQITLLLVLGIAVLYALSCLYAGGVKKINIKLAAYYVVVMAVLGVLGELVVDGLYKLIAGSPLWVYKVLPVHGGYTSFLSILIWGAMGFQIYLVHDALTYQKLPSLYKLAVFFTIEAVVLEMLFDLLSLVFFKKYVYYYLPNNLWHITSLQVIPLYLVSGYFYLYVLMRFRPKQYKFSRENSA